MHCPYCSVVLIEASNGELRCPSAGAYFSPSMRAQFEQISQATSGNNSLPVSFKLGSLYCPLCGSSAVGGVCSNCGAVMTARFVHELIELNPHAGA